jgi:hypothetical protein
MSISKEQIKERLYSGINKGYSHMAVICDSWDYTDFIIYISKDEALDERLKEYQGLNTLYKIMEIYNYGMNLEYQLNEYRAMHKQIDESIASEEKEAKKSDRIEKLPGYEHSFSVGKIKINLLGYIAFEKMQDIPNDINGYIDKDGNFFPSITISSTNYSYNNLKNISMEQFAEAFIYKYVKNDDVFTQYKKIIEGKTNREILFLSDDFLIHHLGFAKFYRYIDASEYGSTDERSSIPENVTAKQLILLGQLFNINHNGSTNIINKSIQYSLKLAEKLKG